MISRAEPPQRRLRSIEPSSPYSHSAWIERTRSGISGIAIPSAHGLEGGRHIRVADGQTPNLAVPDLDRVGPVKVDW